MHLDILILFANLIYCLVVLCFCKKRAIFKLAQNEWSRPYPICDTKYVKLDKIWNMRPRYASLVFFKRVKITRFVFQLKQSNLLMLFQRKRAAEKNLTEMRREVSKQKRLMSTRRCVPLPAITTVRKCVK